MKFKIGRTLWEVAEVFVESNDSLFTVFKNNKEYETANGSQFESETEAEINILNEYRLEETQ